MLKYNAHIGLCTETGMIKYIFIEQVRFYGIQIGQTNFYKDQSIILKKRVNKNCAKIMRSFVNFWRSWSYLDS